MSHNTKNYKTDNGNKWVVGGELAIEGGTVTKDGQEVEFGEGAKGDPGEDGRGIENIERDGNTLVFTMTDETTIEVDLPNIEPEE